MTRKRELITQAAYARRRGVTKNAVWAAVQGGRIRLVDGLVDPIQADRDWVANTDSSKQVRTANGAGGPRTGTYSAHRQRREEFASRLEQLKYEREVQLLISREAYDRAHADRLARALKALLAVPNRLGPVLAGLSPAECTRRLRRELELVAQDMGALADETDPSRNGS